VERLQPRKAKAPEAGAVPSGIHREFRDLDNPDFPKIQADLSSETTVSLTA
jgi:hypothetical protein